MISSVIIAKNEEKNISDAINGLKFSSEIIVVDDYSEDKTAEVAQKLGAVVIRRHLSGDFAAQRNLALERAKGEWVFFVDADERVSIKLKEEVLAAVQQENKVSGYRLTRQDTFFAKTMKHGEVGGARFVRLARRTAGKWMRGVHEYWNIEGEIGNLKSPLEHYPHPTLREFIYDLNFNSTLHAKENRKEGKISNLLRIIFLPKLKFFKNYVLKMGLVDGAHGFVLALFLSFHSFLGWSKLWLLQKDLQKSQ